MRRGLRTIVEVCLKMALWRREHAGHKVQPRMIHHSDAGSQYTSIKFTETVVLEGLVASIGTIGDAYDNAAAETVMGLYRNEAVAKNSPFSTGPLKTLADVEELTFDWLDWYNNRGHTVQRIADLLQIPRSTIYGHLTNESIGRRPTLAL